MSSATFRTIKTFKPTLTIRTVHEMNGRDLPAYAVAAVQRQNQGEVPEAGPPPTPHEGPYIVLGLIPRSSAGRDNRASHIYNHKAASLMMDHFSVPCAPSFLCEGSFNNAEAFADQVIDVLESLNHPSLADCPVLLVVSGEGDEPTGNLCDDFGGHLTPRELWRQLRPILNEYANGRNIQIVFAQCFGAVFNDEFVKQIGNYPLDEGTNVDLRTTGLSFGPAQQLVRIPINSTIGEQVVDVDLLKWLQRVNPILTSEAYAYAHVYAEVSYGVRLEARVEFNAAELAIDCQDLAEQTNDRAAAEYAKDYVAKVMSAILDISARVADRVVAEMNGRFAIDDDAVDEAVNQAFDDLIIGENIAHDRAVLPFFL